MKTINRYTPMFLALIFSLVTSLFQVANAIDFPYGVNGKTVSTIYMQEYVFTNTSGDNWELKNPRGVVTQTYTVYKEKYRRLTLSNNDGESLLRLDLSNSVVKKYNIEAENWATLVEVITDAN